MFDSVEERHKDEVRRAEEEARKQAREEHPDVDAELFDFRVSDKVKKDEEKKDEENRRNRGQDAQALLAQVHAANRRPPHVPPAPPGFAVPLPLG